MKIVIASDFSGYPLKEAVKKHLIEQGHEVDDVGQIGEVTEDNKALYPDVAKNVATELLAGNSERGVLCCGTGAGVSIVANKFKGIYAVACESLFTAPRCAEINQANVIALGNNVVTPAMAIEMVDIWLNDGFLKGFTPERAEFVGGLFKKVQAIEADNFK